MGFDKLDFYFIIPIACQSMYEEKPSEAFKIGFLTITEETWDSITQTTTTTSDFYCKNSRFFAIVPTSSDILQ